MYDELLRGFRSWAKSYHQHQNGQRGTIKRLIDHVESVSRRGEGKWQTTRNTIT